MVRDLHCDCLDAVHQLTLDSKRRLEGQIGRPSLALRQMAAEAQRGASAVVRRTTSSRGSFSTRGSWGCQPWLRSRRS
jgi:hypothetical protein